MIRNAEAEAKAFFENLSRDEFIGMLEDAGFDVSDGEGQVIYTDELNFKVSTTYNAKMTINTNKVYATFKTKKETDVHTAKQLPQVVAC